MRIPREIQLAIISAEKHQKKSRELGLIIREWIASVEDQEGVTGNILDSYIDIIELGSGDAMSLINFIRSYEEDKG